MPMMDATNNPTEGQNPTQNLLSTQKCCCCSLKIGFILVFVLILSISLCSANNITLIQFVCSVIGVFAVYIGQRKCLKWAIWSLVANMRLSFNQIQKAIGVNHPWNQYSLWRIFRYRGSLKPGPMALFAPFVVFVLIILSLSISPQT